tara:strand:+ start:2509 stop:3003 length:495 start_codon:yes stop_codon:yes gene_type:complete
MEKFKSLVLEANKSLKLADHMIYVTYPLIKDNKLLIHILENIDKSMKSAIDAFIRYDRIYKRIRANPQSFVEKVDIFSRISSKRYPFSQSDFDFIEEVDDLVRKHKESPVEFVKGDKFVICFDDYKTKILTLEKVKHMISKAKPFIFKLNNILSDERILRESKE